jgi:hypothetical protein
MNTIYNNINIEVNGVQQIAAGGTSATTATGALANLSGVSLIGSQNISGTKNFYSRPTVNGTGVVLEGEVQNNTIISGVVYSAQVNVKNNHTGTLYKGQPVYINGAQGGNILVGLAANTGESTSSKTLGLIYQDSLAINASGTVITDGLLSNFDVGSAAAGDPIWLGPSGNLIYGLTNKPYAPNHLVYLGVVTRENNNGELFVKVQNGYELDELHDVAVTGSVSGNFLYKNNNLWSGKSLEISDVSNLQTSLDAKLALSTDSYIIVEPGDSLAAKYTEAKALTPNGSAKSAANRASLIIFPGNYALSAELAIDAEFVDVIALGAQERTPAVFVGDNTLNVSANNVRVSGISVGNQQFKITGNKPLQIFENCTGGAFSFGSEGTASGTFTNCVGGDISFGGGFGAVASGAFTNCVGGDISFGSYGTASGIFANCIGIGSFGNSGTASGTFTNCINSYSGFGGGSGWASGTFTNCTELYGYGFGYLGFASGTFTSCTANEYSFGSDGNASGTFMNCIGGANSFGGGESGTASGTFTNCRLTVGLFQSLAAPPIGKARMINCLDGNGDIIEGEA